jgi:hypothetical protein
MMAFDLPPPDPGVEIVLSSRGMSKGIAQTDGPQVIGKGFLRFGDVQAGLQWKNVTSTSADGEGAAFVSVLRKFGSLQLTGGIAYKFQTGVRGHPDSRSWEFTAGASRKFGPVTARLNAVFSPDDLGSARRSLFVEAGPAVQLGKGWTASAAIGHRGRQNGTDYTAFNAGIGKSVGPVQFDLRYYDTNRSDAEIYRGRIVASVRVSF